jgi:hypothetical protein
MEFVFYPTLGCMDIGDSLAYPPRLFSKTVIVVGD